MLCGLYEMDITPALGKNIPGYFEARRATGIREPLFVRALACSNKAGDAFVLVNMDAVSCSPIITDRARKRFEEATGTDGMRMMVSATHAHTGGPVDDFVPGSRDPEYMTWLADRAADCAVMAWNRREPAKLGYGHASESTISFNRRYEMKDGTFRTNPGYENPNILRPAGPIDPDVGILKIENARGEIIGAVTNFACHLDTVSGNRYCPDYPGELGRILKNVYGQNVVSIFLTGACGNINHHNFLNHTLNFTLNGQQPHYKRMGQTLAGDVIRAMAFIETEETETLFVENDSIEAKIRVPSEQAVAEAEAFLKENPYYVVELFEGVKNPPISASHRASYFAQSLLAVSRIEKKEVTIPVQTARLGNLVIAGMPCELFVEFGLDIKKNSGFEHTMISTLTNSQFGYIATREAFEQGGYETTICDDTMMTPQTGYDLTEKTISLLRRMR